MYGQLYGQEYALCLVRRSRMRHTSPIARHKFLPKRESENVRLGDYPMSIMNRNLMNRLMHFRSIVQHPSGLYSTASVSDTAPDPQATAQYRPGEGILVALSGDALDGELMALACTMARTRHVERVEVVYSIAVPRALPVNDEMPAERAHAEAALANAREEAKHYGLTVEAEYIQSRDIGESLVQVARARGCTLLIVGLPYDDGGDGEAKVAETTEEVLRRAPCRVWVVRGQPLAA